MVEEGSESVSKDVGPVWVFSLGRSSVSISVKSPSAAWASFAASERGSWGLLDNGRSSSACEGLSVSIGKICNDPSSPSACSCVCPTFESSGRKGGV